MSKHTLEELIAIKEKFNTMFGHLNAVAYLVGQPTDKEFYNSFDRGENRLHFIEQLKSDIHLNNYRARNPHITDFEVHVSTVDELNMMPSMWFSCDISAYMKKNGLSF